MARAMFYKAVGHVPSRLLHLRVLGHKEIGAYAIQNKA